MSLVSNKSMTDVFSKEKRSEIMSKIRSRGTKIELVMNTALKESGMKFEYQPKIFGKPDFLVFPKVLVFCDSSFWHGRNWKNLRLRLSRNYWYDHIKKNRSRDRKVNTVLTKKGYIVLRFWDTQIERHIDECIDSIKRQARSERSDDRQ